MAYAAVISLKHNTDTPQLQLKPHLEWLEKILRRLDDTRNRSNRSVINALDARIRDAVWKIEDVLESYALLHHSPTPDNKYKFHYYQADHSRQPSRRLRNNGTPQIPRVDKERVEQEIDSFIRTVEKLGEDYLREVYKTLPADVDHDDVLPTDDIAFGGNKSTTVGLSDQCEKIRNELLDLQSGPKVVSLVGMAGIGKTRLAREIYQHPIIVQHFDLLVWVRGGPEQQLKDAWVEIVAEVERKPKTLYLEKNIFTLVELLQKGLHGRRCLFVLDDIWSTRACGCLIRLLGAEGNGRRVLLTTRLEEVAKDVKSSIHQMLFLNNEESWSLLWQNVFGGKSFPPQLEKLGRKIAEKCEGLPLLILAVADILCGLEKTEEFWKKVAEGKTTTFTDASDMISKELFLSYEYLPQYLKPCFLYMGVFPQSCEIPTSKLINLLIVGIQIHL